MSTPDTSLLFVRNLVKRYDGVLATDDLSLDVREGELHAIIGPNGAGKTTLIKQLTGEIRPDSGDGDFCRAQPATYQGGGALASRPRSLLPDHEPVSGFHRAWQRPPRRAGP